MSRKQGVIFSYLLMFLEIISSLLFIPFLIRTLGQAEYGIYSLVASITSYLMLLDLGIGNSIIKYMAKFKIMNDVDNQKKFLGLSIIYYVVISLLVITIGIIIEQSLSTIFGKGLSIYEIEKAKIMFSFTMINVAVTMALSGYKKTILAFECFKFSKICDICQLIVRLLLSIYILVVGYGGVGVVAVNLLCTCIFGGVGVFYVTVKLKLIPKFKGFEISLVKEIVAYSTIILIQMIAMQLNAMVDQILIGAFVVSSTTILAVYATGVQITTYFQAVAGSINGVLMPGVVRMVENGADKNMLLNEMIRIGRMVFILLSIIWSVFLVNGKIFMYFWAGEKNVDGYYVAIIIMFPMMFYLSQSIGTQLLWAMNRHKIQAVANIGVAFFNVVFTYILIQWNPLMGATIATAIAIFLGDVVTMNWIFSKYIGLSLSKYYKGLMKGILPCLLITIFIGFIIKFILPFTKIINFLCSSFIMAVLFMSLMFFWGGSNYEKNLASNFIKKIKKNLEV